ncbi:MAG: 30S ribosomal protein S4 [Candidatus ainarchaeum sp.]|nr:30S ribosomal protein S4 [Candidatus ainarchaeum sp.]
MGDPRKFKNKYESPKKLWERDRIAEEKTLKSEYGLKNSREIWVAAAELKKYRREARRLLSILEEDRKKDVEKILNRLNRFGILPKSATLDDILSLEVKSILERRLQTRVLRKGFAKTIKQSRQLISHGFIAVGEHVVTVPGYLVTEDEDSKIQLHKPIDLDSGNKPEEDAEPENKRSPKREQTEKFVKTEKTEINAA